jgi:hypothetical protein
MGAQPNGDVKITFWGEEGTKRMGIESNSDGVGSLMLRDANGKPRLTLVTFGELSFVFLADEQGVNRTMLTAGGDTAGLMVFDSEGDKQRISLVTGEDGFPTLNLYGDADDLKKSVLAPIALLFYDEEGKRFAFGIQELLRAR